MQSVDAAEKRKKDFISDLLQEKKPVAHEGALWYPFHTKNEHTFDKG